MKKTMLACAAVAKGTLEMVEIPVPEPDDYEVLVKNEGCVFCNTTDRLITDELFATPAYPTLLGHEDFGVVVKVGKKVKKFRLGDRVICASATKGFNGTYHSTWGGFAEYGIAGDWEAYGEDHGAPAGDELYRRRYRHNHILPNDLPKEQAALAFSFAETAGALRRLGELQGKTVVVIGTGFVGYSFVTFAKAWGAHVVCLGRRESRLEIAKKLGADACFLDARDAAEYLRDLDGADLVLEASGNDRALEGGLPYLKEGGTLALYAVSTKPYRLDFSKMPEHFACRRIEPAVAEALPEVCRLLREGKIPTELFLTHYWPLSQVVEAFAEVRAGEVIKGLVCMPEENAE